MGITKGQAEAGVAQLQAKSRDSLQSTADHNDLWTQTLTAMRSCSGPQAELRCADSSAAGSKVDGKVVKGSAAQLQDGSTVTIGSHHLIRCHKTARHVTFGCCFGRSLHSSAWLPAVSTAP